jgi:glycerate 2-kinase
MAVAFARQRSNRIRLALVAGTHRATTLPAGFEWYEAGHPVPTPASMAAGQRALALAAITSAEEQLVVLLSGGASALMAVPRAGLDLQDKVAATRALLAAGLDIHAVNCVRKHLSAIKGGQLAAATPASVLTLAISDVVGPVEDDPSVIGSGPTVPDPTTWGEALKWADHAARHVAFPVAARRALERGARGGLEETPKPGDARLARSRWEVIGSRRDAMAGGRQAAEALGYEVTLLAEPIVGDARAAGGAHLERLQMAARARPACVISSGETTVMVKGEGRGGRNQEFALAAVEALAAFPYPVGLASLGTDGIDGPTDAAGAIVDSTTLQRAGAAGLGSPGQYLDDNNAYAFFEPLGDLIRTGPTETNVGDLQVVLLG